MAKVEIPIQVTIPVEDLVEYLKNDGTLVEVVRCKDCKHRPIVPNHHKNGFDLVFPDGMCPCQCDDAFYSYVPNDNWFCPNGDRKDNEPN